MNYKRIYSLLISSRKLKTTPSDYYENHHIIPRALGGNDSSKNMVKLTGREHFLAHIFLAKIHGGTMWFALSLMKGRITTFSSRTYEIARKNAGRVSSERMKGRVAHNKGSKTSLESRKKQSDAHKGKVLSVEHREKVLSALFSRSRDDEWSNNISRGLKGHSVLQSTKDKISNSLKGNIPHNKGVLDIKVECPHCGKIGGKAVMQRWHFKRCKYI